MSTADWTRDRGGQDDPAAAVRVNYDDISPINIELFQIIYRNWWYFSVWKQKKIN